MATSENAAAATNESVDADADRSGDAAEADGDADADDAAADDSTTTAGAGEAGASSSKTIISWIVGRTEKCRQCGTEKNCGFRCKQRPETTETEDGSGSGGGDGTEDTSVISIYEYLCDQACCDALIAEHPGKYFVRRKKFLVEELPQDASKSLDVGDDDQDNQQAASAEGEGEGEDAAPAAAREETDSSRGPVNKTCLQCKEEKKCKYFLRQEQESFYICDDDCFNLLNAEEPDKFKLKRHSIRVRNIGATTIRSPSKRAESSGSVVARTNAEAEAARLDRMESFRRRCSDCNAEITMNDKQLVWETMDFCNEVCLGSYQRTIGANCETCKQEVSSTALGKYCVRFGFDVRQFCCAACLNTFKKGLKTCSCCQKDISSGQEGFLAPVGDKDQFKDFCSQACLRRYDSMCNPKKKLRTDMCGVCNNEKPVRVEMLLEDKEHFFCSNPCFSAFKFVSNVNADPCAMCSKYFERKSADAYTIYYDQQQAPKMFCSRICINVYIIVNRHIVSCQWCKVKKYNFDMIYQQQGDQETLTCSINCLTMHGVSCNISARTVTKCDNCSNFSTPQYHLTMSDASMRNFCTYQCVMQFQNQFARAPLTLDSDLPSTSSGSSKSQSSSGSTRGNKNAAPFPTGLPKRVKLKLQTGGKNNSVGGSNKKSAGGGTVVPVISTVQSLASGETEARLGNLTVRRKRGRGKLDSPPPLVMSVTPSTTTALGRGRPRKHVDYNVARSPSPPSLPGAGMPTGRRSTVTGNDFGTNTVTETKIITVPPYPKAVRNVNISCKPMTVNQGEQCQPTMRDCVTQTDKDYSNKVLIPVPVPIFVPQPMYMYSAPFPVPVPIPLPIPVPIFIPTTRNTSQGILKEIKKIQDKMPEDPLEAELLMMAEMVAEEKHDSDSDSDNEIKPDPGLVTLQYQNSLDAVNQQQQHQQVVDVSATGHNPYGDDMLQIALKMATGDYDNHHQTTTVDLESTMTANTISNQSPMGHDSMSQMSVHHLDQQHHMLDAAQRSPRGRKRSAILESPVRNNRSPVKRQRPGDLDHSALQQQSQQAQQPQEKPDAQMFLKYTFGVNAWKQWVMTKNADIEKSSMRRRPFKTELLQMTADELNYSLCLFVKEVRKPNGTEYAPDTIYYLVLGIQQYLYVNGRIDNIFYDPYYERFTECLDEVARKFSVLYNDSQYIVTRVEEEHLWECKQLGAHSPHVLLSTLMFFNTKHFNLTTVEEHMQLSFSHIMKHWKRSSQNSKVPGTRNVLLRFYPPQAGLDANPRKKKVYEQQENEDNPLRCPVRLYEFYLSKCPESVKTRNDVFYLQPERSCVPDSPVWYSTQALGQDALQRMLHRVKMVKEINIALLTT
ncbi:zinc finger MYM-type protein 4 isoform X2 [Drosophila willistoni]|uniref:zinc finger MYM-type protein 4 isoform X2 n=1 Tax=Drosophila willistoni TaxID=7260 RepID=UPI001F0779B0|nr:zinc finger MYM-type protein 4 isoform X2 [Drosophila willistoni]